MHALHGVDLWAVTWPLDPTTLRTLTNSSGETALPIFTARALLEEAAMRFGWQLPDGTLPARLTRIEELLRESEAAGVPLLIVDIASDHALELDEHDRKVLEQGPPRTSSRPPAGVPEAPEFGLANTLRPEEQGSESSRPPVMARPGPGNEAERDRPSSRPPVAVGGARFAAMGSAVPTGLRRALREVEQLADDVTLPVAQALLDPALLRCPGHTEAHVD